MKHVNVRVFGRVQGVFFRASTKEQAVFFGLKGFVKNETNGDVYIEVEGQDAQVQKFLTWCGHGPSGAQVDHLSVEEGDLKGFEDFRVER